ncbi:MAG: flagellar filament capping protein FliD [Treponema sp.]|nr:flagellar filament capping protein FliD [Treponema sp.]
MADMFVPGVNSRFNTDKLVEDLMRVQRIPRERAERSVQQLEGNKGHWQEVGRRTNALRDSARYLFSFQHPFSDRIASSGDPSVLTGTATRGALEQERSFTVQQVAQADRFLSAPLQQNFRIEAGAYTFSVGDEEISFDFGGGSLRDFSEALNRRGRGILSASLISVSPGTTSLLIESRVTGEENRLNFSGAALTLGEELGMVGRTNDSRRSFTEGAVNAPSGSSSQIPMNFQVPQDGNWVLSFETSTAIRGDDASSASRPPPGPSIPSAGSVSHGGIVIENEPSSTPVPEWAPPPAPVRVDTMNVLSVTFADGSSMQLPPITDSADFNTRQFPLGDLSGRTIVSLSLVNDNTHRDINIRNVQAFDPNALGGVRPLNPVSTAEDAIIAMDGIQVRRPSNEIDDLIPGVTITARRASDRPVSLFVEPDREAVKDAIISFVGNYNRLMTEINVLTRNDPRVVDELTFLSADERADALQRLGTFAGDSTLMHLRNNLMRIAGNAFPTSEGRELALLSQIGIGTDVRWGGASGGGLDVSRLRGYLEIDERVLDNAIATRLEAMRELFGSDTTGNRLVNSGVAFDVEALTRPFTETGGILAQVTGTLDTRIGQENTRIEGIDRRLTQQEADLRRQYAQMEDSFRRMEQMNNSLNQFGQQNSRQ